MLASLSTLHSSSNASSSSSSGPMTVEDFDRMLNKGEYDQETHALFLELNRITDQMTEAGFADTGRMMMQCRLYDALVEVDPDSLNQHGKQFIVDNVSNRRLYEEYKDAYIAAFESYTGNVLQMKFYDQVPDLSPFLNTPRITSSSGSSARSSCASSSSSDVMFLGKSNQTSLSSSLMSSHASSSINEVRYVGQRNPSSSVRHVSFESTNSQDTSIYTGLNNLGSTCYINSLIQLVYHTIPFRELILKKLPPASDLAKNMSVYSHGSLQADKFGQQKRSLSFEAYAGGLIELQALFRRMLEKPSSVCPKLFVNAFGFRHNSQECAFELWTAIFTYYVSFLGGQLLHSSFGFNGTEHSNITASLVQGHRSLDDAIKDHEKFSPQILPQLLMLHVNRTSTSTRNGVLYESKLTHHFDYPISLDVGSLYSSDCGTLSGYTLRSFIVHDGPTVHSGHYRTFVYDFTGNYWVELNDSSTSKVQCSESAFNDLKGQAVLIQYIRDDETHKYAVVDRSNAFG